MKKLTAILIVASVLMLMGVAYAAYPSLGSGYAVDSNFHGINVPPGSNVVVTAYTTDMDVYQVTFIWHYPNTTAAFGPEVDNTPVAGDPYEGKPVNTFSSTHQVAVPGDWGVQALFQSADGKTKEQVDFVISTKATSFFVIPEPSIVLGILGSFGALALYAVKRRKP
jgi:hypothetical protein